jgi:photosystem II stability/assembly factor-like uncharacterized protein
LHLFILFLTASLAAFSFPSWKPIGPWGGSARAIRVDQQSPNELLAIPMLGSGVFLSRDAGASWHESPSFPRLGDTRLDAAWIAHTPEPLYLVGAAPGGIWLSNDRGDTWTLAPGTGHLSVYALTSWSRDERTIAAGTNEGVWLSNDGARSWRRISPKTNLDMAAIVSVAIDPTKAGTIYAGTPHLPWKSTDGGATWRKISTGMFDDSDIFSIHVNPLQPSRVFASACSGIYSSPDGGTAWRRVQGIPGTNRRTYVVIQSPHASNVLFAGTSAGMWASVNGGTEWAKRNEYVATSIAFHPADNSLLYISTERHGLLKSTDGGTSFTPINQGFTNLPITGLSASGSSLTVQTPYAPNGLIAVAPNSPWTLPAEPAGKSEVSSPAQLPPDSLAYSQDPFFPANLLAASRQGLLRSTDKGGSWIRIEQGLGKDWVGSVAHHPKRKGYAFALRGQRVFWSRDHGETWYWLPAEEKAQDNFERLVTLDAYPDLLFAISRNRGVFVYSLHENPLD